LGKAPAGDPSTILAVTAGDTAPQVTVSGIMIEKCPVAGCWFRLRDSTGVIKVDTKPAGFVVVSVPLESTVTVAGKVVAEGDEVVIAALAFGVQDVAVHHLRCWHLHCSPFSLGGLRHSSCPKFRLKPEMPPRPARSAVARAGE
jgi:uncharacterized protein YdeI (BOF family)